VITLEVQIKKLSDRVDSNICHVPNDIFAALNLSTEVPYKINLGQSYDYSYIVPNEQSGNCMYFSKSVFKKLMLFQGITLNIWRNEEEIYLGPVVGIFVKQRVIERIRIGKPSLSVQKHGEAASGTNCLAYYYSIEEISWGKGKIKGYTFDRTSKKWRYDWFPMPDVLYDLGVSFSDRLEPYTKYMKLLSSPWIITHKKPNVDNMLRRFRAKNVHFINNQRYLGKWDVHEGLSKYPDARIYLPKTIIYKDFNDILSMLNEFNFIFVKATGGAQGKQVLSIEQIDKKYKLTFNEYGLKEIEFNDIADVKRFIKIFSKERDLVVQQGIRLIKYNGRNMDIRMLMMKDGRGKWQAVQHHCRIAQKAYTITNMCLGGDWINYEEVYPRLCSQYPDRRIPDKEKLINETRNVIYYFEKEFGSFGEIGMDMAVDMHGKIWFIEANTKPDKIHHITKEIPDEAISIFEYAKFLASNE
jgi:hypothetical protein